MFNITNKLDLEDIVKDKSKYYPELDAIRGLAIFLLLCYHTDVANYLDLGIFPARFFEYIIFTAGVPVFFFLSGLGLTIKYKERRLNIKQFYKNRYSNLVPPYIIWSFLIMLLYYAGEQIIFTGGSISDLFDIYVILDILINIGIQIATGHVYTLWFVYVLFLYYLLFPFVLKLFKKINQKSRKVILLVVFLLTFLIYFSAELGVNIFFIDDEVIIYAYSSENINFNFDLGYFFRFAFYFVNFLMGITLAFNYEDVRSSIKKNRTLKILIFVFSIFCYTFFQLAALVWDISIIGSTKTIFLSTSSILLCLLIFLQFTKWDSIDIIRENALSSGSTNDNPNKENMSETNLKERIQNANMKFWWYTGQRSTGIYFTHRIIMAPVWIVIYIIFNVSMWQNLGTSIPRAEAFVYAAITLGLTYVGCIILIKIIRKLPYNKILIGK